MRSRLPLRDPFAPGPVGRWARRVRSALSALGIAVAIAALVAVLGIAASAKADLLAQLGAEGNLLTLAAGQTFTGNPTPLPATAEQMIKAVPPVREVTAVSVVQQATVRRSAAIPVIQTRWHFGASGRAVAPRNAVRKDAARTFPRFDCAAISRGCPGLQRCPESRRRDTQRGHSGLPRWDLLRRRRNSDPGERRTGDRRRGSRQLSGRRIAAEPRRPSDPGIPASGPRPGGGGGGGAAFPRLARRARGRRGAPAI